MMDGDPYCNPLIIAQHGDMEDRWEVWCRACGHERSVYTDSLELAQQLRDSHVYQPKPTAKKDYLETTNPETEYVTDWSESIGHTEALERSPHVGRTYGG